MFNVYVIRRFHQDNNNEPVPYFIFGDFNFRVDTAGVIKVRLFIKISFETQSITDSVNDFAGVNRESNNAQNTKCEK